MDKELNIGKPVSGEHFIGREKEMMDLVQYLRTGQSVVLIAPRRFGKTSLMLECLASLKHKGLYTLFVDVFATPSLQKLSVKITEGVLSNRKLDLAFRKFRENIRDLLKNVEFKQVVEKHEYILTFGQNQQDEWKTLEDSIDFIERFAADNRKKIVCGFDEFGDLNKLDGKDIIKLFRSKIQLQKNVSYIFSGSYESVMNQMFTSSKSPFYRFARVIYLGGIDPVDYREYFNKLLSANNISISTQLIDQILLFTHGHPYYTNLFLREIIHYYQVVMQKEPVGFSLLLGRIVDMEKSYLDKAWEEISSRKEERAVILALAAGNSPYTSIDLKKINVTRALTKLKGNGTLLRSGKQFLLTDPLLNYWIQKNIIE
jgi:uncharacterized protein